MSTEQSKEQKQEKNGKAKLVRLAFEDLNKRYENRTAVVRCECIFATECVGGQPADEDGIRQFVQHHLKITDPTEAEAAVKRIMDEELEEVTPAEGELPEGKVYGVRALRRDKRGSKGDVAEVGRVRAWKYSLGDPEKPWQIYALGAERTDVAAGQNPDDAWTPIPPETYHKDFMGRVQSPSGPVSIIHKSECLAPGTRFAFEFRFLQHRLSLDDIQDVLAFMMTIGLGSARSLERGKFRIEVAEIEMGEAEEKAPKADKKDKKKKDGDEEKAAAHVAGK